MSQFISANRLIDGLVVYTGRDGSWVHEFGEANIFTSKAEAEAALLLAQNDVKCNLIVDPCLVEVTEEASGLRAVTLRESIRARGPTIDFLPQTRAFAYEVAPIGPRKRHKRFYEIGDRKPRARAWADPCGGLGRCGRVIKQHR